MTEFLSANDPVFYCLRSNFNEAYKIYQNLKNIPNEETDLLHLKAIVGELYQQIGEALRNLRLWRRGESRAQELGYLKFELKDFELKVFSSDEEIQAALSRHGDQFVSTCAKFAALFNEGRLFAFDPDL